MIKITQPDIKDILRRTAALRGALGVEITARLYARECNGVDLLVTFLSREK